MPRGGSDETEADDLVFLSPEEDFPTRDKEEDQGASPALPLRRSNRKRKSTTNNMMGSGSKKKKASPTKDDPGRSLPRIPRTLQGSQGAAPGDEQADRQTTAD